MSAAQQQNDWLFHHETWDELWSSDDFPAGETLQEIHKRIRAIQSEPWWASQTSEVVRFLRDELRSRWPWGYTIYRTVYTPESEQWWSTAVEAIPKNVFARSDWQLANARNQEDAMPHRILQEGYRALVFNDKEQFDGATYNQVRQRFKALVDNDIDGYGTRFRFCLIIDEESLRSIIGNPDPQWGKNMGACVTVIDPNYHPGRPYPILFYPGYFRLYLNDLWWLSYIGDTLPLPRLCGRMLTREDTPWFDGDI